MPDTTQYVVRWTSSARRDLARLPARIVDAVLAYVDRLEAQPLRMSKALSGDLAGYRSARNGDYRILITVEDATVWIVRIDHRAHVYRPR